MTVDRWQRTSGTVRFCGLLWRKRLQVDLGPANWMGQDPDRIRCKNDYSSGHGSRPLQVGGPAILRSSICDAPDFKRISLFDSLYLDLQTSLQLGGV